MGGCGDEDLSEDEKTSLQISKVELLFAPKGDGVPIVVEAEKVGGILAPSEAINLQAGIAYDLFVSFENATEDDVSQSIENTGTDYQLFYEFSQSLFSSPTGSGNIADHSGLVNYLDQDTNGLPIGLITAWVAADSGSFGVFRIILKHQPDDLKIASADAEVCDTELDVSWELNVN